MSQETLDQTPPPPVGNPRQDVGGSTRRGFLWLMTQTVFGKIVNSISTLVAAWFLLPEDYKLVALAFPITQFITVMQQMGVDKVLIARGTEFDRWLNPGFWMSTAAGLASGLLVAAAAPVAAHVFGKPELQPMLLLLSIAAPLNGITTVHQAWLQYHFRFRQIALMGAGGLAIQAGLTIVMAWMRFGPYALIVPVMANAFFRFGVYWGIVRLPLRAMPEFQKWSALLKDSFGAFGSQFNQLVVAQGDFLLLGVLLPPESTLLGYFVFAFNLSTSVITSLVVNLATVMFPALSTMANDPQRQTQVYLRASRRIAVIGMPLCLLQAAVASPLLHAIYADKWNEAILPLQILSVCMAIRVVCVPNYALFSAQGRFHYQFVLSTIYAVLFLGAVAVGAMFKQAAAVAWAESIYFVVFDNVNLYLAIRYGGGTVRDILRLYSVPTLASVVAVGSALAISLGLGHVDFVQVAVTVALTGAIYVPLIFTFDRSSFDETVALIKRVIPLQFAPQEPAVQTDTRLASAPNSALAGLQPPAFGGALATREPSNGRSGDSPIRILHVLPFSGMGGGAPLAMLTLVVEQQRHYPTWVLSLADNNFAAEARKTGATVICAYPTAEWPSSGMRRWLRTMQAIRQAVRQHHIDLIHCHSAPGNRYCYPASRLTGVPLVSHQRDTYQQNHFHAWVHRTDAIIAISEWVRKNLPEELRGKVTVVNDAVAIPDESQIVWPRATGRLIVGMAGRCVPEKGLDLLVDAAAALARKYDFGVEIWGCQPETPHEDYPTTLQRQVDEAGLHDRFQFERYRPDMDTFYRKIDILVTPSRVKEGFGLTAAEGQAWGKAVLVAGHGGLTEIVEHGQTGLQFTPDDVPSLTRELERLLTDADLRLRLAQNGRQSAAKRYAPEDNADQVVAVYRTVLGQMEAQ